MQGTTDMSTFRKITQQLSFRVFILKESHNADFEISSPQTVFADHCALVIVGDNVWKSNQRSGRDTFRQQREGNNIIS